MKFKSIPIFDSMVKQKKRINKIFKKYRFISLYFLRLDFILILVRVQHCLPLRVLSIERATMKSVFRRLYLFIYGC